MRTLRIGTAGVALTALALAGCGGSSGGGGSSPSVAQITARIQKDTSASELTAPQAKCIAGVLKKYVSAADLNSYLSGKTKTLDDVPEPKATADAENAAAACESAK
jgi:hypothetical protein